MGLQHFKTAGERLAAIFDTQDGGAPGESQVRDEFFRGLESDTHDGERNSNGPVETTSRSNGPVRTTSHSNGPVEPHGINFRQRITLKGSDADQDDDEVLIPEASERMVTFPVRALVTCIAMTKKVYLSGTQSGEIIVREMMTWSLIDRLIPSKIGPDRWPRLSEDRRWRVTSPVISLSFGETAHGLIVAAVLQVAETGGGLRVRASKC